MTLRPGGGPISRPTGIGFNDGTFISLSVDYAGHRTMYVTDDSW